jgi:hypothetical protein
VGPSAVDSGGDVLDQAVEDNRGEAAASKDMAHA